MKHTFYKFCFAGAMSFALLACETKPKEQNTTEQEQTPENAVPDDYKAIDLANFDTTVRPQDDFFKYVNGNWLKNNPVPASETRWTSFNEILERNRKILKEVTEEAEGNTEAAPTSAQGQVAAFYASGMNKDKREELGMTPLDPYTQAIDAATSKEDLLKVVAEQKGFTRSMFSQYATADEKNSGTMALYLYQGGMSLPTKSYYSLPAFEEKRNAFKEHLKNTFVLLGSEEQKATQQAENVMKI